MTIKQIVQLLEEDYVTKEDLKKVVDKLETQISTIEGVQSSMVVQYSELRTMVSETRQDVRLMVDSHNKLFSVYTLIHDDLKKLSSNRFNDGFSKLPALFRFTIWLAAIMILQIIITVYAPPTLNDFFKENGMYVLVFNTLVGAFFTVTHKKGGEKNE